MAVINSYPSLTRLPGLALMVFIKPSQTSHADEMRINATVVDTSQRSTRPPRYPVEHMKNLPTNVPRVPAALL